MARVGVLGGTFDPPHNGHLAIAQAALAQLQLAEVLFAPTHQPPHKLGNEITPIEHRLAMVRLAIAPHPRFTLSRVDVDRAGPTFTVDTMRLLRQKFPDAELYFIMGTDSLANILTWRAPAEFIRLCRLAVFNRPGFTVDLDALEAQLPGLHERAVILPAPALDIAASDLQQRVCAGLPITDWVPAAVATYIAEHGLYRDKT